MKPLALEQSWYSRPLRALGSGSAALALTFSAALVGPAGAQVTLSWEAPKEIPGAQAFDDGRYELAASEVRSALERADTEPQRIAWTLELARALYGAGDQVSADRLAMETAEKAAAANLPSVALKALLVAAEAGMGRSFQQRLELVDMASSVVKQPLPANVELRVQTDLVRALIQTRNSPAEAIEAIGRGRTIAAGQPSLAPRLSAWLDLVESRARGLDGNPQEALPLAVSAHQQMATAFGPNHPLRIYSGMQLALVHRLAGNYPTTRDLTGQYLRSASPMLADAHPWTMELMSMKFQEQLRADDVQGARVTLAELLPVVEKRHGKGTPVYLEAQSMTVDILMQEGSYAEALRTMGPLTAAIGQLAPGGPAHLSAKHKFATVLSRNDQVGEALLILQDLVEQELKTKGPTSPDVWASLNNLAGQYRAQRNFGRALDEYARLESLMRPRVQRTHTGLVAVVNNTAEALVAIRRPAEARDRLRPLIDELVKDRKPSDSQLLRARSNLASALLALKDTDAALAEHRSILGVRRETLGSNHPDTLTSMAQIAYVLDVGERYGEATEAYLEVYRLRKERLGSLHADTIQSARAAAGILANPMGRFREAADLYDEAIRGVEVLRQGIGLPPEVRQMYFSDVAQMYKNQARILAKLDRWQDAFSVIEMSKSRTLVEQTRATAFSMAARLTADEQRRLAEAERLVARLTSTLSLSTSATPPGQVNPVEQERDRALVALRLLRSDLGRKYGWSGTGEEAAAAPVSRANTDLEADDAFVSFSLIGDALMVVRLKADGTVGGGILDPIRGLADSIAAINQIASVRGGLDQVQVGSARQPARILWRLSTGGFRLMAVEQPAPEGATVASSFDELAEFVSGILLRAIPPDAWNSRRLLLSPDGQLATAPFDLLVREGQRWSQTHELTIAQSWTMHVLLKERERAYSALRREPILVFGNPEYSGGAGQGTTSTAFERRGRVEPASPFGKLTWFKLAGAGREVSALADIYPLTAGKTLFVGASATEANLQALADSGSLSRFKVVHFATHGYLHPRNPWLSSVVLAEAGVTDGKATGLDGYVTAADWLGLRLRSDLTVVAACDSGGGEPVSGEGIVGLPFGLFAAGNRSTLLTLWSVYDEATAEFIRRFHAHVSGGKRFSTALALTKREFMDGKAGNAWSAPAFWAPFVLYGI